MHALATARPGYRDWSLEAQKIDSGYTSTLYEVILSLLF